MFASGFRIGVVSFIINAVVFAVGVAAILALPPMTGMAKFLIPALMALSLAATPFIANHFEE